MNKSEKSLSRRDFLKLASLLPAAYFTQPLAKLLSDGQSAPDSPGVIILVFDALSARNMSLYEYPLPTMPALEKFAENAIVYHNHYSAGSFTIPGTASLLTGLYPWSHRAFTLGAGGVVKSHIDHQLFAAFAGTHKTVGYSQNKYSDSFLYQFGKNLNTHISSGAFNDEQRTIYDMPMFEKDGQVAFASFNDNLFQIGEGYDSSIFLGTAFRTSSLFLRKLEERRYRKKYPRGLPDCNELFLLSDLVDGAIKTLRSLKGPSVTYLHFHPPHHPYRPTAEFSNKFYSIYAPPEKPVHPLSTSKDGYVYMRRNRQYYDEYLLSWDTETARLFDFLQTSGLLDNNYVIVTSDHGELFERGETGHFTPLMYDALVHVPLVISCPGRKDRQDVVAATCSVDVLPTLAQNIKGKRPSWDEGELLPALGGIENPNRSIYTLDAKKNAAFAPLREFSVAMTKSRHRLTYYKYADYEQFEFYNLDDDPEEMNDLYSSSPVLALQMKDEMLQKLSEVNQPYQK
jgi:arylsulfatase A-like enzyme